MWLGLFMIAPPHLPRINPLLYTSKRVARGWLACDSKQVFEGVSTRQITVPTECLVIPTECHCAALSSNAPKKMRDDPCAVAA